MKGFTDSGLIVEGEYENNRNQVNENLFKSILREVYQVQDVIIGHHLIYVREDKREDGFVYQVVEEIPSADALIFNCEIMEKVFSTQWVEITKELACTPVADRDAKLSEFYYGRTPNGQVSRIGGAE